MSCEIGFKRLVSHMRVEKVCLHHKCVMLLGPILASISHKKGPRCMLETINENELDFARRREKDRQREKKVAREKQRARERHNPLTKSQQVNSIDTNHLG